MEITELNIPMKPLSVNEAWQGRRYKTDAYKAYEMEMLLRLPKGQLPAPPYRVRYEFGFSNRQADFDNPCKPIGDILQKKYGFNDNEIYEAVIRKKVVPRGHEYIRVNIEHMEEETWHPSKKRSGAAARPQKR